MNTKNKLSPKTATTVTAAFNDFLLDQIESGNFTQFNDEFEFLRWSVRTFELTMNDLFSEGE
jgi:hypothetical protein